MCLCGSASHNANLPQRLLRDTQQPLNRGYRGDHSSATGGSSHSLVPANIQTSPSSTHTHTRYRTHSHENRTSHSPQHMLYTHTHNYSNIHSLTHMHTYRRINDTVWLRPALLMTCLQHLSTERSTGRHWCPAERLLHIHAFVPPREHLFLHNKILISIVIFSVSHVI